MADLIINKVNVTQLLQQEYKKLDSGWITLIQNPPEYHQKMNTESVRILTQELKYTAVYITLGKPCSELDSIFKKAKINTEKLFFVDAISQMYGQQKTDKKRFIYTAGPLDIDAISVSLRSLLSRLSGERVCVLLDSVSTVLLYNSLPRTVRFSQFLTKTLKELGVNGVIVSVSSGAVTEKLTAQLKLLCDEFIDLSQGEKWGGAELLSPK
jgi:hypothetical protein